MIESLLLSILGALVGILLMLPFNGMTTGTSNQVTFSEVVFALRMTPGVILAAVIFGIIVQWKVPAWDKLPAMPMGAKVIAAISLLLWVGAILAGNELPALSGLG